MSKDPAVLWYTSDFLTGTMLMTNEQVGKYARVLCLQHQKGHLTNEEIYKIVGNDEKVMEKFIKDNRGKFYNKRMHEESIKRKQYSESRSKNRKGKGLKGKHMKNISKTYEKHMENENEDENKDINNKSFNAFWEKYHSVTGLAKTDKEAAIKKYNRLKKIEKENALNNIQPYYDTLRDKNYPHKARTYLNDKLFNNEFNKNPKKVW